MSLSIDYMRGEKEHKINQILAYPPTVKRWIINKLDNKCLCGGKLKIDSESGFIMCSDCGGRF